MRPVVHALAAGAPNSLGKIESVELLGFDGKLMFQQQADGLHIRLPEKAPGEFAYVFRVAGR